MKIPSEIITSALLPAIAGCLAAIYLRRPKQVEAGLVRLPKFVLFLGIIVAVMFGAFAVFSMTPDEPQWVPLAFVAFACMGLALVIAYMNCRIVYDEEGFTSGNFFGKKNRYTYDQVTGIKQRLGDCRLFMGSKTILIDGAYSGKEAFIATVQARYKATHEDRPLPQIP